MSSPGTISFGKPIWVVDLTIANEDKPLPIQPGDSYSKITCSTKPDPRCSAAARLLQRLNSY